MSTLRERLSEDLKTAMKARDQRATSALRMILAALKDRDIAALIAYIESLRKTD